MQTIEVKDKQTLMDIALQVYGDLEGVFWLVEDNNLKGIVDRIITGQLLKVRETNINPSMKDYLSPYTLATAGGATGEGIGFWFVGQDFKVT